MKDKSINIEKMIHLFNHIAMREGYNLVTTEIDPLRFFSSKEKFYRMVDSMIEYYIDTEEYEKCALLLEIKKQNGWKEPEVI